MKIGLLQCGMIPDDIASKHGDYDTLYGNLLEDREYALVPYMVVDGVFPDNAHAADGWLISGSKFGAYEDLPWIARLEDFLRDAYRKSVPIVGICFGHQILAQALGGKVEKFKGGWAVGGQTYDIEGLEGSAPLIAWHQDQVVVKPDDAEVVGSSDFCDIAALSYGDKAYSLQPHPEFSNAFAKDLLQARREVLPPDITAKAEESLDHNIRTSEVAALIDEFFKRPRTAG